MPVYEYRCLTCDDIFERFFPTFQRAAEATMTCPTCEGNEVKRLISAPMFRGSGMEEDDFSAAEEASSPPKRVLMGRKELEARAKK